MSIPSALSLAPAPRPVSVDRALRVGVLALGGLGGSSRVAYDLACGLATEGHQVCMLSSPDPWWRLESRSGVTVVPVPVPRAPEPARARWVDPLAAALARTVQTHDLQVLSVHYGVGLAAAAVHARHRLRDQGRALRICTTLHGTDVTHWGDAPRQGPALAEALRACDAVTAVSDWLAGRAHRLLALPVRPQVIANGVDTDLFRPAALREVSSRPVLCHASNFRAVKRPLDAIDVLGALRGRGLDADLVMVGDGPLRPDAEAHAASRGLDKHVRFLPPAPPARLAALLRTVDLSLVTSASESFGLFALESMATGVPVLGTRCGGLEEVFAADASGELGTTLLADVGDVEGLALRAARVLSDAHTLVRLRRRALTVGRTAFPRRQHLRRFAAVLDRIAPGDHP
ncbi:MAG: glycosyltransferase [Myxococcota bacterium]